MDEKDKLIRKISIQILEKESIDQSIQVIEKNVRSVLSTGVSDEKVEQIVTKNLESSEIERNEPPIQVYDLPKEFRDLFVNAE